jgi:hypothetical protein
VPDITLNRKDTIVPILGVLVVLFMIGIAETTKETKPAPPPLSDEQQNAKMERACTEYLASIYYRTYEELSESERRKKAVCEIELQGLQELKEELKNAPPNSR